MIIHWDKSLPYLTFADQHAACSCRVRNEINGLRKASEVVYTMPGNVPYMPREFPNGEWEVGSPRARESEYLAPWFIPTDAWQDVDEWRVLEGMYIGKTGDKVRDYAYGIHFSPFAFTLGCVRLHDKDQLLELVMHIQRARYRQERVIFQVEG